MNSRQLRTGARRKRLMLVVGLTGDVGAGKSTVSSIWHTKGARIVSADSIVAELWNTEELTGQAVRRWGSGILSPCGVPDPEAISKIIFSDRSEYRWICETVHPVVRRIMAERISELDGWVVTEIPLLFENGVPGWVDLTVYVSAPIRLRASRNDHRGWSTQEITRREQWLMGSREKAGMSDFVIRNDGSLDELANKAAGLASRFVPASTIIGITAQLPTDDMAGRLYGEFSQCGFVAGISSSISPSSVSAFIKKDNLEKIMDMIGEIDPDNRILLNVETKKKIPKHILLWAMEVSSN